MRKRYARFLAAHRHALDLGVGGDDAVIEAVRAVFSKNVRRSDAWRLMKGRGILERLDLRTPTSSLRRSQYGRPSADRLRPHDY